MTKIPENVITPDILNTRIVSLTFRDGVPSDDAVEKVYAALRLYSPLEAFFDKSWKVGEIELVD